MNPFKTKKPPGKATIIIGCGRLGATLAAALSENGETVSVIDRSKDSFRKLSPSFGGITIVGNATDLHVLEEAITAKDATVVCVTNDGNANIMAAQMAKVLFKAGRVIARLYDPEKACIYKEHGVETICPSTLCADEINAIIRKE